MTPPSALHALGGRALAALLRDGVVSAREVMTHTLARLDQHNPALNAIVARVDPDACLALADEADRQRATGRAVGPLHGLPWAFKEWEPVAGLAWTRGSPIFRGHVATEDSLMVARVRAAGVLPIGKTNISEFTMGSQSYNPIYGTTRNPWDVSRTAGGSSGGAAAAVAAGLLPMADGSDLGGSLRNPASFTGIVALRPSLGLVPMAPVAVPHVELLAKGPMARSVEDVAFLLSVMAGADDRDITTWPSDPQRFLAPLTSRLDGVRVAWCPDLGGLPVEPAVRAVLSRCRDVFVALGCVVEEAAPDLADADDIFLTLRAWLSARALGPWLTTHRAQMKPEAVWQVEHGLRLTADEVASALEAHARLLARMTAFEQRYAFTVCAVSQVAPFPADLTWPRTIDGVPMHSYIDWMRSCSRISVTHRPALSVPAGHTDERLPVGLQIVGRFRDDWGVLALGAAFEAATASHRRPFPWE